MKTIKDVSTDPPETDGDTEADFDGVADALGVGVGVLDGTGVCPTFALAIALNSVDESWFGSVLPFTMIVGVLSMPTPSEMGEAYMVAFVAKKNDAAITRYFTLEYDYVNVTKSTRTILCEREGSKTTKRGEGSPITGDFATDASAFIELVMRVIEPPITKKD